MLLQTLVQSAALSESIDDLEDEVEKLRRDVKRR